MYRTFQSFDDYPQKVWLSASDSVIKHATIIAYSEFNNIYQEFHDNIKFYKIYGSSGYTEFSKNSYYSYDSYEKLLQLLRIDTLILLSTIKLNNHNRIDNDKAFMIIDPSQISKELDLSIKIGVLTYKQEVLDLKQKEFENREKQEKQAEQDRLFVWNRAITEQIIKMNSVDSYMYQTEKRKLDEMRDMRDKGYGSLRI